MAQSYPLIEPQASFVTLIHDYEQEFFDSFPEQSMFWGKSDVAQDKFMDHSLAELKYK